MFHNLNFLSTRCLAEICGGEKFYVHTPTMQSCLLPCLSLHRGQYQLKMQGKINPSFFQLLLTRYLVTVVRKVTHKTLLYLRICLADEFGSLHQSENSVIIPGTMYLSISSHKYTILSLNTVNLPRASYYQIQP